MVRGIFFLCGTHLQYTLFLIERGGCYVNKLAAALIIVHIFIEICLVSNKTSTSQSRQMMNKPNQADYHFRCHVCKLELTFCHQSEQYMYRRLRLAEQISGWARPFMQPRKQGLADCSPRPEACDAAKQGSSKIIISDPFST